MRQLKKALKRLFFLPIPAVVLIAVPSFAAVAVVLANGIDGPPAYTSYFASAYALAILVARVPGIVRALRRGICAHPLTQKALNAPLSRRYAGDLHFRTEVSLGVSFGINLLYIIIKLASGLYYRSAWFIALAVYYALLAAMRLLLLWRKGCPTGEQRLAFELRRYRLCGWGLLGMNLALSGIVFLMVKYGQSYAYPGMLIYAMAAYSFYAVTAAAIRVVTYRRHGSPLLSAAKAISLAAALVSLLSLETAMLAQFGGGDDPQFQKIMTAATGSGVCAIVLGMALFMIIKATHQLKLLNTQHT